MFANNKILESVIYIFGILLSFVYIQYSTNIYDIANFSFYLYLFFIIVNLLCSKSISLFQVWNLGFVYVVISEMLFSANADGLERAVRYILNGNNFFLLGYIIMNNTMKWNVYRSYDTSYSNKKAKVYVLFFVLLCFYIYSILPQTLAAVAIGRYQAKILFPINFEPIVGAIGMALPAFIGFFYKISGQKYRVFYSLIWTLPIFSILFLGGTRFPLLFSVVGFALSSGFILYRFSKKNILYIIALGSLFIISTPLMMLMRIGGSEYANVKIIDHETLSLSQKLALNMSNEGVVNMTNNIMNYCDTHGFLYGESSSFILYFWIPRAIWESKPVMLGSWFPQYLGGAVEGHSVAFGMWGEFYVDYGYFSFIIFIILGILLKVTENTMKFNFIHRTNSSIICVNSFLFSYVFFAVRSPLTATYTLIGLFILYKIFKKILK